MTWIFRALSFLLHSLSYSRLCLNNNHKYIISKFINKFASPFPLFWIQSSSFVVFQCTRNITLKKRKKYHKNKFENWNKYDTVAISIVKYFRAMISNCRDLDTIRLSDYGTKLMMKNCRYRVTKRESSYYYSRKWMTCRVCSACIFLCKALALQDFRNGSMDRNPMPRKSTSKYRDVTAAIMFVEYRRVRAL